MTLFSSFPAVFSNPCLCLLQRGRFVLPVWHIARDASSVRQRPILRGRRGSAGRVRGRQFLPDHIAAESVPGGVILQHDEPHGGLSVRSGLLYPGLGPHCAGGQSRR